MSDDVIPRYSLVMNTNYWPLKDHFPARRGGRGASLQCAPAEVRDEGEPWSRAGGGGAGPGRAGRAWSGPAAPAPPRTPGPRAATPHRGPARPRAPQADCPPPTPSRSQEIKTIHLNAIGAAAELRRLLLRLRRVRFSPRLARRLRGLQMRAVVASGPGPLGLVGVGHPAAAASASASATCAEGLRARQWRRPGKR